MTPVPPYYDRWRQRSLEKARTSATFARTVSAHIARGLTVLLPLGATLWLLWWAFVAIDELIPTERILGRQIRGVGAAVAISLSLAIGLLAANPWGRLFVRRLEGLMLRIPFVKLLFSTVRDFVHAFFGKKRFDKPVLVKLGGGFDAEVIGFITRQNLEALGILDKVAVYFPQSYNIGGNVLILPRDRLTPLEADSALVMSFILTGGIASVECPVEVEADRPTPALRPMKPAVAPEAARA